MTPFEMFGKLIDKFGIASVRHEPIIDNEMGGYAVYNDAGRFGPVCETKEGAIEAAYKKIFPLIEKEYGVWAWDYQEKRWYSRAGNRIYAIKYAGGYSFLSSAKYPEPGILSEKAIDDFYNILFPKNPDLLPPTEDGGPEKSEASP